MSGGRRRGGQGGSGEKALTGMKRKMATEFPLGIGPIVDEQIEAGEPGGKSRGQLFRTIKSGPARFVLGVPRIEQPCSLT